MCVHVPRVLTVAALIASADCGGAATTPSTPLGAPAGASTVHRGVPQRSVQATYPTHESLVFEADQTEAAVNIYETDKLRSNPPPIATIHVAKGCPYGMAVDKMGTLYVSDFCGGNDVELYPNGSTTMSSSITDGLSNPLGLAIDKSDTLYVSNNTPPSITEYAYGTNTPSKTITGGGMVDPHGIALDENGNLYIADYGASSVFKLHAGGSSVRKLHLSGLGKPIGLAIDRKTGYLWEAAGYNNVINVYDLASGTSPIKTIQGNGWPYAISDQHVGFPDGEVVESDLITNAVYAFKPGSYKPYATLTNGVDLPTGVLVRRIDKPR